MLGYENAIKTFTNLPPHWSLSVRFDIIFFDIATDNDDYLRVYLDSTPREIYKKYADYGTQICGAKDYLLFFSSNMTTHTASSITVVITANTTKSTTA